MIGFDTVLHDLLSIPKSLLSELNYYLSPEGKDKLEFIRKTVQTNILSRIVFIGHSYNYFASLIPFYYINSRFRSPFKSYAGQQMKKECLIFEIDEFLSYFNPRQFWNDTQFVLVSQSGQTMQIKECYQKLIQANVQPNQIWGVTNDSNSFLARSCNHFFPVCFGTEELVGSKSYVNSILILFLIARAFLNEQPLPAKLEDEIRNLIYEVKFYGTDWEFHTKSFIDFLGTDYNFLYFIAKGSSISSAYQGALHCKTYSHMFGEAITTGLFMHGPFQIVDDRFRCILILGDETSIQDTIMLIQSITQKLGSGKVILVINSRQLAALGRSNPNVFVFEHTTKNTYLAPIFEIVVMQFLLLQQAKRRGVIT